MRQLMGNNIINILRINMGQPGVDTDTPGPDIAGSPASLHLPDIKTAFPFTDYLPALLKNLRQKEL